ncbi:alanine--tRNA ligase-related protein, partial [Adlercreutzia mucosicola]|uniref:alanine--tRNA ligase-related protein n=1 Tax=Adlercreutzia mucosicola TaxID=580026 RepID=UPI002B243FE5
MGPTAFVGYDATAAETHVVAIVVDGERVGTLAAGQTGEVVLAATPFYAEMGGEVGDTGLMENGAGRVAVLDTRAPEAGLFVH